MTKPFSKIMYAVLFTVLCYVYPPIPMSIFLLSLFWVHYIVVDETIDALFAWWEGRKDD